MEGLTQWRASLIPNGMNGTAAYKATFGMDNMVTFVAAPGTFGELRNFLNRDMGLDLPFEIEDNFGLGEVIDASPPPSPIILNDLVEPDLELKLHAYDMVPVNSDALVTRYTIAELSDYKVELPDSPPIPIDAQDASPNITVMSI